MVFLFTMQDIQQCSGPLELLDHLNAEGRAKIAMLKSSIEQLAFIAEMKSSKDKKDELLAAVNNYKKQLNSSLVAFRKANIVSACAIDKLTRENLFSMSEEQQNALRKRRDKQSLTNTSNQVTDKLMSIARHLADTTQRSADTLDTLCKFLLFYYLIIISNSVDYHGYYSQWYLRIKSVARKMSWSISSRW